MVYKTNIGNSTPFRVDSKWYRGNFLRMFKYLWSFTNVGKFIYLLTLLTSNGIELDSFTVSNCIFNLFTKKLFDFTNDCHIIWLLKDTVVGPKIEDSLLW